MTADVTDSVFRWLNPIPASPKTLNRLLGEYCAPKTPAPPVVVPVIVTSVSAPCVDDAEVAVEVVREYQNRGLM